jgi:hypothetical protein
MYGQILAMLILTTLAQVRDDQRTIRESPPRGSLAVYVPNGDDQPPRAVTFERPAPPDDDPPMARIDILINKNLVALERENFDRWLFDDRSQDAAARLRHLDRILQAKTEIAAQEHKLTERHRLKLRLAGRGDIKRFFDHVETRKRAFEIARGQFKTGVAALRGLDPLSRLYQEGPFGDGSLFAKTLHKIKLESNPAR